MAERSSIDIYIDAEFKERLRAAGINCSRVARDAWRTALAQQEELQAALGPVSPLSPPAKRRGPRSDGKRSAGL